MTKISFNVSVLFVALSLGLGANAEEIQNRPSRCEEESGLPLCSVGLHIHCCPVQEEPLDCGKFHIPVQDVHGRWFCMIKPFNQH